MKPRVYIETSVISYLTARISRDVVVAGRQAVTLDWWERHRERFDLFISELVEEELLRGDPEAAALRARKVNGIESLDVSQSAEQLAEKSLSSATAPTGSEEDALHIAIASAQGMDYLLTWNFKHINNVHKKAAVLAVVESCGFCCPALCSPEALGGADDVRRPDC
jgi:hypothetical protein